MSNNILLFSDIHIHAHKKSHERLKDCLKVLHWVFEVARKNKIKNIIFAGDLFQERQKIDVMTYNMTFDALYKECDGEINLYLLLGNHDLWFFDKWDISSVIPFSTLPGVTVINKACTLEISGHNIDFLPFVRDPIDHLSELSKSNNEFLVAHLAVHGAALHAIYNQMSDEIIEHDGNMVKIGPELFQSWKQVFLGHYHNGQIINNIEYIGSPLQLNFGEAFQEKNLIIYDLDNKTKNYIVNDFSPKHYIGDEEELQKFDLSSNFVRLNTDRIKTDEIIDLKKGLQQKKPASLEIIKKKIEQKDVIRDAKAILNKEDEMLEAYVKNSDTGDLDKQRLLEIGKMICTTMVNDAKS